jgi:hypothetical protein
MSIYKISLEEARSGAVFPGSKASVLTLEGKCSLLRAKAAHSSGHLLSGFDASASKRNLQKLTFLAKMLLNY